MSDLTLLTGAAVFAVGMVTGRAWPSRRRKPKPVEPVCGCSHHHSFHDPQTSACHATEHEFMGCDERDNSRYEMVPCGCRKYAGPEPLPEYYAPELGASS